MVGVLTGISNAGLNPLRGRHVLLTTWAIDLASYLKLKVHGSQGYLKETPEECPS